MTSQVKQALNKSDANASVTIKQIASTLGIPGSGGTTNDDAKSATKTEYDDLKKKTDLSKDNIAATLMKDVYSDLDTELEKFVKHTASAGDVFKSFADTVVNSLMKMQVQAAAASITMGLANLFHIGTDKNDGKNSTGGISAGSLVTALASLYLLGRRASGGPVIGGTAYLVGEEGPEIFVPSSSGTVLSNEASFGGRVNAGSVNSNSNPTSIRFNVINNTSSEITADNTGVMADADGYIIDVVLNAAANNKKGFNRNLKTALGVG